MACFNVESLLQSNTEFLNYQKKISEKMKYILLR